MQLSHFKMMEYSPSRDCERTVERYADLADSARAGGNSAQADDFLLLAWAAYDEQDLDALENAPVKAWLPQA